MYDRCRVSHYLCIFVGGSINFHFHNVHMLLFYKQAICRGVKILPYSSLFGAPLVSIDVSIS